MAATSVVVTSATPERRSLRSWPPVSIERAVIVRWSSELPVGTCAQPLAKGQEDR